MRRALLGCLVLGTAAIASAREAPPAGELVLDLDRPVIDAVVAGVPLRLLVALDARPAIELNPEAAARLPIAFEAAGVLEIGRVTLARQQAQASVLVAGRTVRLPIETHGRRCCATTDGMIAPDLLPFARIRLVRAHAASAVARRYPAMTTPQAGLAAIVAVGRERIAVRLAPDAPETLATGAAASILAEAGRGRWDGAPTMLEMAYGVARPVRPLRLAEPVTALGFRLDRVLVRTADFRGTRALPGDPAPPGEIVVTGHARPPQHEWIALALGKPQLDSCAEIDVERVPAPVIVLHCAAPAD